MGSSSIRDQLLLVMVRLVPVLDVRLGPYTPVLGMAVHSVPLKDEWRIHLVDSVMVLALSDNFADFPMVVGIRSLIEVVVPLNTLEESIPKTDFR